MTSCKALARLAVLIVAANAARSLAARALVDDVADDIADLAPGQGGEPQLLEVAGAKDVYQEAPEEGEGFMEVDGNASEEGRVIPPALFTSVKKLTERACSLRHMSQFKNALPEDRTKQAIEEGIGETKIGIYTGLFWSDLESGNWWNKLNRTRLPWRKPVDPSTLPDYFYGCTVDEDDAVDSDELPSCSPGAPFLDCVRTMRPSMWLQQAFNLDDRLEMLKNKWYCPWCKSKSHLNKTALLLKRDLYYAAVEQFGFEASASQEVCKTEAGKPEAELVRKCIMEHEAQRLSSSPEKLSNVTKLAWTLWQAEDEELVQRKLATPEFRPVKPPWWDPFRLGEWVSGFWKTKVLKDELHSLGFHQKKLTELCHKQLSDGDQRRTLERIKAEVTSVCSAENNCTEVSGTFCPEGTMCDCQRPWTPERATKAFGLTFWAISPLTVGLIAGTAAFATGGLAAIPSAVWTAGWFPDYIPAALAMAAFSRKWEPECMCFEMACGLDEATGQCELTQTKTMKPSSNPYVTLPSSGIKCTREHGSASSVLPGREPEETCKLQMCDDGDVNVPNAGGFFGRVGRIGTDLYNCVSVNGTTATVLGFLDEVPGPDGKSVPNSPAARVDIYNKLKIA